MEIIESMGFMGVKEYKKYCEEFFQKDYFQSIESFNKEIGDLNSLEFKNWQLNLYKEYNNKEDEIREIIKYIRAKENFNLRKIDIDWENDPMKKEEYQVVIKSYRDICNNVFNEQIAKFEIYGKKQKELEEYFIKKQYEDSLKVTVNGKDYIAEKVINVLWSGWECDGYAWLVNDDSKMKVVMTNHGATYFADKSVLEEKLKEYQDAIKNTQDILNAL